MEKMATFLVWVIVKCVRGEGYSTAEEGHRVHVYRRIEEIMQTQPEVVVTIHSNFIFYAWG